MTNKGINNQHRTSSYNRCYTASLGELCDIARGGSPRPIDDFITDETEGLNWLKIGDTKNVSKYIYSTKQRIKKEGIHKTRVVKEGDFILSNSMSFGKPFIMKIEACIHDGWLSLRIKDNKRLYKDYLYYLLGSKLIFRKFSSSAAGSSVKNLNIDLVKRINVTIPPISKQKEIANTLQIWDTAIEKTEALIAAKQKQLCRLAIYIIGKNKTCSKKIKCLLESGEIIIKKGTPLIKNNISKGEIPVIAGGKISPYSHNQYTHSGNCITVSSSGAYAGHIWYHSYPIWASDCNVLYSKIHITMYLYYALKCKQAQIYALQSGGAQPHIYAKDLSNLFIVLPQLQEQKRIVRILNTANKEITMLKQLAKRYHLQKHGLMQRLLMQRIE